MPSTRTVVWHTAWCTAKPAQPTEFPPPVKKTIEWLNGAFAEWYRRNPPPMPDRFTRRETTEADRAALRLPRQALHAYRLTCGVLDLVQQSDRRDRIVSLDSIGAYRLLLADLIVVTMAEHGAGPLVQTIRRLAPDTRIVETVLRPTPLQPIAGRRVFYVTTAPEAAGETLVDHLETEHGATVTGTSHNLARRPQLAQDLLRRLGHGRGHHQRAAPGHA